MPAFILALKMTLNEGCMLKKFQREFDDFEFSKDSTIFLESELLILYPLCAKKDDIAGLIAILTKGLSTHKLYNNIPGQACTFHKVLLS
jgi:hypothetical protein